MDRKYTIFAGQDYHDMRMGHPAVMHSLKARTGAIVKGIREFYPDGVDRLLDIGGADGLMASGFKKQIPEIETIYSLDLDFQLLKHNPLITVQADAINMPFADNSIDVITAAALIEHLYEPGLFLQECFRVLKPRGGIFLTCPAPFFEWVATKSGYLKNSGHVARYGLGELKILCEQAYLNVVFTRKFMFSPISLPYGEFVESCMTSIGLSFLFLNQVVGAVKLPNGK